MSFYALLSTNVDYTIGEKFSLGGQMLLIGMGVIFSVLLLLWGALELFHYLCATLPERMKAKKSGVAPAPKEPKPEKPQKVKPSPAPVAQAAAPAADTELIAVITAAIAASENAPVGSFRVVSFRRV